MMMRHKVKINVDDLGFGHTFIDGREIEGLVAVGFNAEACEPTEVTLVLRNTTVEVDASVDTEHLHIAQRQPHTGD